MWRGAPRDDAADDRGERARVVRLHEVRLLDVAVAEVEADLHAARHAASWRSARSSDALEQGSNPAASPRPRSRRVEQPNSSAVSHWIARSWCGIASRMRAQLSEQARS